MLLLYYYEAITISWEYSKKYLNNKNVFIYTHMCVLII